MPIETYYDNYLQHHGIKGMKWGVRRYQNPDGTRTAAGIKQYEKGKRLHEQGHTKEELQKDIKRSGYIMSGVLFIDGLLLSGLIATAPIIAYAANGMAAGAAFTAACSHIALKDIEEYEKESKKYGK